jgi:hypothetical protein
LKFLLFLGLFSKVCGLLLIDFIHNKGFANQEDHRLSVRENHPDEKILRVKFSFVLDLAKKLFYLKPSKQKNLHNNIRFPIF